MGRARWRLRRGHVVLGSAGDTRAAHRGGDWTRPQDRRDLTPGARCADRVCAVRGVVIPVDRLGRVARRRARGQQQGAPVPTRVRDDADPPVDVSRGPRRVAHVHAGGRRAGGRAPVQARLGSRCGQPRHRRPTRRSNRLLQLDRCAVHDRDAPRDRVCVTARASRASAWRADRVRLRWAPACGDRSEPRLAVHAPACRARDDRDPARPPPRGGRRPDSGRGDGRARAPVARRLPEDRRTDPHPRRVERRSLGTADLRAGVLRRDADRVGGRAPSGSAAERGAQAPRGHDRHRPGCPRGVRWSPGRDPRPPVQVHRASVERIQPSDDCRHWVPLHRRRQRPLRLLAGVPGRVSVPSDRRVGPGQLRRLLHNAPPYG